MRFLIAGLGSIGRRHLKNLVSLGQTDIILLRSNPGTQPDDELKSFPMETDLQRALEKIPDAIIVSNPTSMHLKVAVPAVQAGCCLFLEKPISNNLDGIGDLESAAREQGVCVLMGFQFRFHPGLKKIKDLLQDGAIGRVLYARCHWGEYLPGWHPGEDYRRGYSARKDMGGGVVLTLCHPIDYLHWLLGDVTDVFASVKKASDLEIDVEDCADIFINFSSGASGTLHLDYFQQPPRHTLEITGTHGTIQWDHADGIVHHFINATGQWNHHPLREGFSRNDLFLDEMRHFVACIEEKLEPICTLKDGIYAQLLIDAVYRSSMLRAVVKI
jgi:predicted dehydrogenase